MVETAQLSVGGEGGITRPTNPRVGPNQVKEGCEIKGRHERHLHPFLGVLGHYNSDPNAWKVRSRDPQQLSLCCEPHPNTSSTLNEGLDRDVLEEGGRGGSEEGGGAVGWDPPPPRVPLWSPPKAGRKSVTLKPSHAAASSARQGRLGR